MSFAWPGLWPALDTTPAYIGHNTYLRRPQHLLMLASAVTCIGHNTSRLHRPKHFFTSATTPAYVGQCFDLRRPQHLSFTSATTSIYVSQNTCLCRPQHLLTSASAVTCIGHNTSHLCPQKYRPKHRSQH